MPPAATTGTASGIGASTATLNGTVDPNSRDTTFYFEYGTSTSLRSEDGDEKRRVGGDRAGRIGRHRRAAAPGRTYHFRIVASSDAGTSTGKDSSFTTSSAPTVVTSDASSVTPTSARLRGTVTPNGLSTKRWFEYGTTTSYGTKTSSAGVGSGTSATSVSATVKKLKAARTYHFRLVARNSSGTSFGADETFSTVGPPSAQTAAAQGVGPDVGVLTGSLDTRGRSTRWRFDYGTSGRYGKSTSWKSAGSKAGARTVSATRTGLTPSTTYHYRLVAKSDAGTAYGADVTFTTTGVTLTVLARQVVFGRRIRLSGVVPTHRAGEQVVDLRAVLRRRLVPGQDDRPHRRRRHLGVSRDAEDRDRRTRRAGEGARALPLRSACIRRSLCARLRPRRFVVRVVGGRSFARRLIQLQRRSHGRWSTIRRVRLGARSGADFRAFPAEGALAGPDRLQRQSGRRGLPRRHEPGDHRQAVSAAGRHQLELFDASVVQAGASLNACETSPVVSARSAWAVVVICSRIVRRLVLTVEAAWVAPLELEEMPAIVRWITATSFCSWPFSCWSSCRACRPTEAVGV